MNYTLARLPRRCWMTWEKIASRHSRSKFASPTLVSSYCSTAEEKVPVHAPIMATVQSCYRLSLPLPAISLYSKEGKELFDEAWKGGTAAGFMEIATNLTTQTTCCGLADLSSILNALSVDPQRVWKGCWRWYDESMLASTEKQRKIKADGGISLKDLIDLVPKDKVKLHYAIAAESSLQEFRKHVLSSCSSDSSYLLANYSRYLLDQPGPGTITGSFSPIGAYAPSADVVLIMDSARFILPPYWVPCSNLWEATSGIHPTAAKTRGFMVISKP